MLDELVSRCVDVLDIDAAGVFLLDHDGPRLLSSTDPLAEAMQQLQVRTRRGPGVQCCRSGEAVHIDDLADTASMPPCCSGWDEAVNRQHTFRAVHAVPLRQNGDLVGGLEVLRHAPGALSPSDTAIAQGLAGLTASALVAQRRLRRAHEKVGQLQTALDSRVIIEQAKGILAQHHHLAIDGAFELLRRYARRNNLRVHDVAAAVVDSCSP